MSKKRLSIVIPVISWCCTKNDYDSFDIYIFIIISNVIIILKTFDIFLLKGNCINFQTVSTQVSFECCTDNSLNMVRYAYMCDILFVLEIPTWLCFSPEFCSLWHSNWRPNNCSWSTVHLYCVEAKDEHISAYMCVIAINYRVYIVFFP